VSTLGPASAHDAATAAFQTFAATQGDTPRGAPSRSSHGRPASRFRLRVDPRPS